MEARPQNTVCLSNYQDIDQEEDGLSEPWNLVRIAMGSLTGESWRLKQALVSPSEAFDLRAIERPVYDDGNIESNENDDGNVESNQNDDGSDPGKSSGDDDCTEDGRRVLWERFQNTQTYDVFKRVLPFRPNTTNNTIEFVIVGDPDKLEACVYVQQLRQHLEAFIGFPVKMCDPQPLGPYSHPRLASDKQEQVGAHYVLAQLRSQADSRSVCTIGLTTIDLYPPSTYEFVTGITDATQRVGLYSVARYYSPAKDDAPSIAPGESKKELLTQCFVKTLCREVFKLCRMGECQLLHCLMNPFPGGPPEAIRSLPLSLCCICLRKLHWLTQADLLDRYARLPEVLGDRFGDETAWLKQRMVTVGMPTYKSLCNTNPLLSAPESTGSVRAHGSGSVRVESK